MTCIFTLNITLPQVFWKYFASEKSTTWFIRRRNIGQKWVNGYINNLELFSSATGG